MIVGNTKKNPFFHSKKATAKLAIKKYHTANQWFWSGLIRYPLFMLFSMLFMLLTGFVTVLPSILLGLAIDVLKID